jgi:Helix-turn-helix of DDE superfamily endonuclease
MAKVVAAEKVLAKKSGRPSKLSIEDQLLMTLQYWREYRTYFHMEMDWGLDETNVLRNVRKIENILIKSGMFNVGKKQVVLLDAETEVLVVDVAEHEIERPKKSGCIRLSCGTLRERRGEALRAEVPVWRHVSLRSPTAYVAPSNKKDITAASKKVIP